MFIVNDIKTGFTKLGTATPSKWTETELICPPSGHSQNIIYKDIGTTSGYIEFDYTINTTESFSGHCVFRIRSKDLSQGQYYNQDGFNGIALQWWGANNSERSLFLYENGSAGNISNNVLYRFDTNIANKTLRIKILWNEDFIYVSVGDEEVVFRNKIKEGYTYIDFGFANYAGTITRTIQNISNIPIPSVSSCEVVNDKLHISIDSATYEVSSIDILYNNLVAETIPYMDSYIHDIDKEKMFIGKNSITIRINSNFVVSILKTIEVVNNVDLLNSNSSLMDVSSCVKSIYVTNKVEYETLKSILINKNIEVLEEDKMFDIINKVSDLPSSEIVKGLQNNQYQIINKISNLEQENQALKEELIQIQISIASLTSLIATTLEEK